MPCVDRILMSLPFAIMASSALADDNIIYHCVDKPSARIETLVGYAADEPNRLAAVATVKARIRGSAQLWRPETLQLSDALLGFPTTIELRQNIALTNARPSPPSMQVIVQFVVQKEPAESWFGAGNSISAELKSELGTSRGNVSRWPAEDDRFSDTPDQGFAIQLEDAGAIVDNAKTLSLDLVALNSFGQKISQTSYIVLIDTLRKDLDTAELAVNELMMQYKDGRCGLTQEGKQIIYYGATPFPRANDTELYLLR